MRNINHYGDVHAMSYTLYVIAFLCHQKELQTGCGVKGGINLGSFTALSLASFQGWGSWSEAKSWMVAVAPCRITSTNPAHTPHFR
jgi:hypothetical protein